MKLAQFKRLLQSSKTNGQRIKSTIYDHNGNLVRSNDFANIGTIQSNCFSLLRGGFESWSEFGKASDWQFSGNEMSHVWTGGKVVFEFENPEFFGL